MEQSDEFSVNAIHEGAGGMRELLAIALPMVVSQACDTIMMFTDRLFLSRLGPEEMNASMAGGLMCFVMMTFFLGLTGYSTALVAQYLGSGRKDRCATATTQAMLIALTAYPLILLARPLVHFAFAKTGISPGQLTPQIEYFDVVIYATVIGLLRNCMSSFFSGIGRTRIVMISAVTAMLVNVGMNYILIFGKLGFPALGIRGAAYATIIGGCVGLGVLLTTYLSGRTRRTFRVWHSLRFDREAMGKLLRFGYPAGIEMFLNLMAFNAMIIAFHAHSPATATAVTVMFNWDMVSFVPLIGIQIGVMSLVGRYMGAGNPDLAHRSAISGLKCGWLYSVFILMLFVFLPKHLVDVFRPEQVDAIFHEAAPDRGAVDSHRLDLRHARSGGRGLQWDAAWGGRHLLGDVRLRDDPLVDAGNPGDHALRVESPSRGRLAGCRGVVSIVFVPVLPTLPRWQMAHHSRGPQSGRADCDRS